MRVIRPPAAPALLLTLSALAPSAHGQSASRLTLEGEAAFASEAARDRYFGVAGCTCARPVTVEVSVSDGGAEGALALVSGKGCLDSDGALDSDCEVLWEGRLETAPAVLTVDSTVDALLGGCEAQDGDRTLSLVADVDDQDRWAELDSLAFAVDTRPPEAPESGEVVAGEGLVVVAFTVDDDEAVGVEYQVLCRKGAAAVFSNPPEAAFVSAVDVCDAAGDVSEAYVCAEASGSASSAEVLELEDGVEYTFWVVAVDAAGNPSEAVKAGAATPAPEQDLFERYKDAGGRADGGHCFVATAAYGDYGHPQVRTLRAFRDQVLARSALGRLLVEAYYWASPPIAGVIAEQDSLRAATRAALTPLVWIAARLVEVPR